MLNNYLDNHYNKLKDIATNIAGRNSDDLLSYVIEQLYDLDTEKVNAIIKKDEFLYYIIRIMVNSYHSKTSRYYYIYKKYYEIHISSNNARGTVDESTEHIDAKIELEEKMSWIEDKLKECYWFDAECFKIYYSEKHSLNSMSKATGINRNTLHKAISNVKEFLKEQSNE